jgi:hypothetical protein
VSAQDRRRLRRRRLRKIRDKNGHAQAFVDLLKKGAWQKASAIATVHNHGGYAQVSTVSCPSAGFCAAGGSYSDGHFGNTLPLHR